MSLSPQWQNLYFLSVIVWQKQLWENWLDKNYEQVIAAMVGNGVKRDFDSRKYFDTIVVHYGESHIYLAHWRIHLFLACAWEVKLNETHDFASVCVKLE